MVRKKGEIYFFHMIYTIKLTKKNKKAESWQFNVMFIEILEAN